MNILLINPSLRQATTGQYEKEVEKQRGVFGEGEETIAELVNKLESGNNLEYNQIKGLIFKKNGQIIINPARPLIENLDTLSFPARHLYQPKNCRSNSKTVNNK